MNLLITAIGKRVQLIEHLKRSFNIIGVDSGDLVPASFFVDKFYKVPRFDEEDYIESLICICERESANILIPLYEREFSLLIHNRALFEEKGILLLLSPSKVINTFNSKLEAYNFFISNDIMTPRTYTKEEIRATIIGEAYNEIKYPLIVKPENGMGSQNVFIATCKQELEFFINYVERPIIQEFVKGIEYTIDVLCNLDGEPISIIPRERIEVRSGEVSKTKAVKDMKIIKAVMHICSRTKFIGPITVQCIVSEDEISFIEINPRFGGGVPLAFECGVDYGKYIKMMAEHSKITPIIGEFEEKTMLRFDEAVFI